MTDELPWPFPKETDGKISYPVVDIPEVQLKRFERSTNQGYLDYFHSWAQVQRIYQNLTQSVAESHCVD